MARRFLWVVAGLVVIVLIAAIAYRLFGTELMRIAMVPTAQFEAAPPAAEAAYSKPEMWISRPGTANDPSLWVPEGAAPAGARGGALQSCAAAGNASDAIPANTTIELPNRTMKSSPRLSRLPSRIGDSIIGRTSISMVYTRDSPEDKDTLRHTVLCVI